MILIASCNTDDEILYKEVEFIAEYSATITVGGGMGKIERTFEVGEVYKAIKEGDKTIPLRIAEHSDLNEDCPDSWCTQEFLDVPREYLRFVK